MTEEQRGKQDTCARTLLEGGAGASPLLCLDHAAHSLAVFSGSALLNRAGVNDAFRAGSLLVKRRAAPILSGLHGRDSHVIMVRGSRMDSLPAAHCQGRRNANPGWNCSLPESYPSREAPSAANA